jgi:hypothetical protein
MDREPRRRSLFRFSIARLLFLMLCVGGYLGGYRTGYSSGKQAADDALISLISYPVGDLLSPTATGAAAGDYDFIIDHIVRTVSPNSWMNSGSGEGEIQPFPNGRCLIIAQNRVAHEKISALLEVMRKAQAKVATAP